MSALREAAQQALEALEQCGLDDTHRSYEFEHAARAALRAALAQQEQEPVTQMRGNALARWAHEQEEPPDTDWQRGYEAARRWVRQVGLPSLAQQEREDIAQNLQSRLDAALLLEERRQEIAQPRRETEQEPVAWRDPVTDDIVSVAHRATWETDYGLGGKGRAATYIEPLYTAPPRREWQSLTEDEIRRMGNETPGQQGGWNLAFARAVEAKLKEKNA